MMAQVAKGRSWMRKELVLDVGGAPPISRYGYCPVFVYIRSLGDHRNGIGRDVWRKTLHSDRYQLQRRSLHIVKVYNTCTAGATEERATIAKPADRDMEHQSRMYSASERELT